MSKGLRKDSLEDCRRLNKGAWFVCLIHCTGSSVQALSGNDVLSLTLITKKMIEHGVLNSFFYGREEVVVLSMFVIYLPFIGIQIFHIIISQLGIPLQLFSLTFLPYFFPVEGFPGRVFSCKK